LSFKSQWYVAYGKTSPAEPSEEVMPPSAIDAVVLRAIEVRNLAYAKYSNFRVGAALLSADGRIFAGCNVENSSYGLTICAERAAVCATVAAGQQRFMLLAVATAGGAAPCGACRQVLAEFAPDLPILLIDVNKPGRPVEIKLGDIFPAAFLLDPEP
jgi:cytidine deaminase